MDFGLYFVYCVGFMWYHFPRTFFTSSLCCIIHVIMFLALGNSLAWTLSLIMGNKMTVSSEIHWWPTWWIDVGYLEGVVEKKVQISEIDYWCLPWALERLNGQTGDQNNRLMLAFLRVLLRMFRFLRLIIDACHGHCRIRCNHGGLFVHLACSTAHFDHKLKKWLTSRWVHLGIYWKMNILFRNVRVTNWRQLKYAQCQLTKNKTKQQ